MHSGKRRTLMKKLPSAIENIYVAAGRDAHEPLIHPDPDDAYTRVLDKHGQDLVASPGQGQGGRRGRKVQQSESPSVIVFEDAIQWVDLVELGLCNVCQHCE